MTTMAGPPSPRGFRTFLAKECAETLRTWRLWVVPGVLAFAAVTSPLLTALLPTLAEHYGGGLEGFSIDVGTPVAVDAYLEYLGNLGELVTLVLVIVSAG